MANYGITSSVTSVDTLIVKNPSAINWSGALTQKGDLWVVDSAGKRLPVGTNGQVLTADNTTDAGFKWNTGTITWQSEIISPLHVIGQTPVIGTITCKRSGPVCTVSIKDFTTYNDRYEPYVYLTVPIPSWAWPTDTISFLCISDNDWPSVNKDWGELVIQSDGIVRVYKNLLNMPYDTDLVGHHGLLSGTYTYII